MIKIGTPNTDSATRLMLLGSGELAKEIAIEAQRFGIEVIAVDRYANAPAMQVAHRCHVISMLDGNALRQVVEKEKPNFIVPEIEAIHTETLLDLENAGFKVVPSARATQLTMNRKGIRCLAAEELKLKTSQYLFASTFEEFKIAVEKIGLPCMVKPIMSSSGKGQSTLRNKHDIEMAWEKSQQEGRASQQEVIIEEFIQFDYEITLLTITHQGGTLFCPPIGHLQIDGDYHESWQPHPMPQATLNKAHEMAEAVTKALGGYGLYGVEFFIQKDEVYFSEVSPRPHDTGLVTLASQDLSEFALHVRAILGLPIPTLRTHGPAASCALLAEGYGSNIHYQQLERALCVPDVFLRLFGKPKVSGKRRVGVVCSLGETIETARLKAREAMRAIEIKVE